MAAYSELTLEQGATFSTTINVEDPSGAAINLTGYTANSEIRKSYFSTNSYSFLASITGTANGEITLSMTSVNTANISAGRYLYDLLITAPDATKTRVVEGIVTVSPGITKK